MTEQADTSASTGHGLDVAFGIAPLAARQLYSHLL